MTGRKRYRAHGLDIASDLVLPELRADGGSGVPHIRIELVERLPDAGTEEVDHDFVAVDGGFLMRAEGAAGFYVQANGLIQVCPDPDADMGLVQLYLVGSALGLGLHQLGFLVMHAAAVLRNGTVTLFVGDSGAGKSTLAARFANAGYPVLADDVVAIHRDADGHAVAWPGSTSFKLWEDGLPTLELEASALVQVANRMDKYYVPNARQAEDRPYPLGAIIELETATDGGHALRQLSRLAALRAVATHTYRPEYVPMLGRQHEHLARCAHLAATVSVMRFTRPWRLDRIETSLAFLQRSCPG